MKVKWAMLKINDVIRIIKIVVKPVSIKEYDRRREKILNILLTGTVFLSLSALLIVLYSFIHSMMEGKIHHGDSPVTVFVFFIFFLLLLRFSKRGYYKAVSIIFVSLYVIAGVHLAIVWGSNTPQALLIFALSIILSGILISRRFSNNLALFIIALLICISYIHASGYINPDSTWRSGLPTTRDALMYGLTLGIIALVANMSHKEVEASFHRAEKAQKILENEKALLDRKVKAKVKELQKEQLKRAEEMNYFINTGKLASGLIHDLINPLTMISLNIDALEHSDIQKEELKRAVKRSRKGVSFIESYIEMAQIQMRKQSNSKHFNLLAVINNSIALHKHNLLERSIQTVIDIPSDITIYGNTSKLFQVINNLLINAIESFDSTHICDKTISVRYRQGLAFHTVLIQDNGKGMRKETLKNIFTPFYSSKLTKGIGLGLFLCKDIIENDFKGFIKVKSFVGRGSKFMVKIARSEREPA